MPGAVAQTSTLALTNATLPYILEIANSGYKKAMLNNENLMNGLNIYKGKITHKEVSNSLSHKFYSPAELLLDSTE